MFIIIKLKNCERSSILLKNIISVFLIILIIFSIVGCNKDKNNKNTSSDNTISGIIQADDSSENTTQSENSSNESSNTSSDSQSSDKNTTVNSNNSHNNNNSSKPNNQTNNTTSENTNLSYKDIICQSIPENGWKTVELVSKTDNSCISLNLPKSWEIVDSKILKNNNEIGEIKTKAPQKSNNSYESYSLNEGTTVFKRSIEEYIDNGKISYKRLFRVSKFTETVGSNIFFIAINYSELDNAAAAKILGSIKYLGTDRNPPQIENDSKVFLILGNSFLNSSKIADFLSDMLITDGSKYAVEIRLGETVVDFANNQDLITDIEKGTFAYIFQCGFYYNSEQKDTITNAFKTILDACEKSNTSIVQFPAHNEHLTEIKNVLSQYENLYCLNWKEEINSLIESGVSHSSLTQSDFCENDSYKHSTPLAGYVGAHMIYRNIFGSMPPKLSSSAPLDMSTINTKLLTYPTTGIIPGKVTIIKYYI